MNRLRDLLNRLLHTCELPERAYHGQVYVCPVCRRIFQFEWQIGFIEPGTGFGIGGGWLWLPIGRERRRA